MGVKEMEFKILYRKELIFDFVPIEPDYPCECVAPENLCMTKCSSIQYCICTPQVLWCIMHL